MGQSTSQPIAARAAAPSGSAIFVLRDRGRNPVAGSPANWLRSKLSRETSSGRFIPEMDGLRFVAIAMVISFHLRGYLLAKSPYYSAASKAGWLAQVASVGFHGVELFFVISGFILALPFAAHYLNGAPPVNLRKYYLRRLTRLEPPYFVTVLALFLLAVWLQGKNAVSLMPHLGASLFYLHNLIYGAASTVIGVAWSLEIEVQFYILVPALTLLFQIRTRWMRRLWLIALILATVSAQSLFLNQSVRASLSIFGYLQFFLAGFLLADVYLADWEGAPGTSIYWDLLALVGWPLMFFTLRSEAVAHWIFAPSVFLLYCAAFRGSLNRRILSNPWITAIGGMCYSIYLVHYEVISAVGRFTDRIRIGGTTWYFLIQFVLVGMAILVICGSYFVLLEKPCMYGGWWQQVLKSSNPENRPASRLRPIRTLEQG